MTKKKHSRVEHLTQTTLASRVGMTSIAVGKLLVEMGLKDAATKLPTQAALDRHLATTVEYQGHPMGVWKQPIEATIRDELAIRGVPQQPTMAQWAKTHKAFFKNLEQCAFEIWKGSWGPDDNVDAALVRHLLGDKLDDCPYTASQILNYWRNS